MLVKHIRGNVIVAASMVCACAPAPREAVGDLTHASLVANAGQWVDEVAFAHVGGAMTTALLDDASVVYGRGRDAMQLRFVGADEAPEVTKGTPGAGKRHFFLRDRRVTDVPAYDGVTFEGVYDGVDVGFTTVDDYLKYDVFVRRHADASEIVVECDGADALTIDERGDLVITSHLGEIRQPRPTTWQEFEGRREVVDVEYRIFDRTHYGFDTSSWDKRGDLVIDPELEYASYIGGAEGSDMTRTTLFAGDGDLVVVGVTSSVDFFVTPGAFDTQHENEFPLFDDDIYVMRLDPTGSELRYSTFIGGGQNDFPRGAALRPDGCLVLGGWTGSADYPTTPGSYRTTFALGEGFVTCLAADGASLVYSTFVGGGSLESVADAAFTETGSAVLVGETLSTDYPTTPGAFDDVLDDLCDGFVTRVNADGTGLVWSTLIGEGGNEAMRAVGVNRHGDVVAGGSTSGVSYVPGTPGAMEEDGPGNFVAGFAADGTLTYLTYIPSDGLSMRDIAVLDTGEAIVVGEANGDGIATTPGAFQPTTDGAREGFIARLDAFGSKFVAATHLGGPGLDRVEEVSVDASGVITISGNTLSTSFPTTPGAFQETEVNGPFGEDVWIARVAPGLDRLFYSTYLHGLAGELGMLDATSDGVPIAVDPTGDVLVGARTNSPFMLVTESAFDPAYADTTDAYLARLDMTPTGVEKFGASTPGADGPIAIGVTAMPRVGASDFGFYCSHAPRNGTGFLLVGLAPLVEPLHVGRAALWVHPSTSVAVPVEADGYGYSEIPLRLDGAELAGLTASVQYVWPTPAGPTAFTASNGVTIEVQP